MYGKCPVADAGSPISDLEREYCSRYDLPLPRLAPSERLRNMLCFRNRSYLYNGQCAVSGKKMLTCFPPKRGYRPCDVDIWHSDRIDNREFGKPYDFTRRFFEQFVELYRTALLPGLTANRATIENCDYADGITYAKNCYLVFASSYSEDCMFCYLVRRCRSVLDCVYCFDSEFCYECTDVRNCVNLKWSSRCNHCSDSCFLFDCSSCTNCFGCTNLSHKQYHYYNQPLSKTEYFSRLQTLDLTRRSVVAEEQNRFTEFSSAAPVKYFRGINIDNCSGDYLYNSKNCEDCYFVSHSEDCAHCLEVDGSKNCIVQALFGFNSELVYNSLVAGENAYNLRYCIESWSNVRDLEYCIQCMRGVEQCYGCVGLTRASYCVLNRQYTKTEYLDLTRRIREQMRSNGEYGCFFPITYSPFYYNESSAQMFYPLEHADAVRRGFSWHEDPADESKEAKTPPESLDAREDQFLNTSFACSKTGKAFRFVRPELNFYRTQSLPPPDQAPMERMRHRLGFYNLATLGQRDCSCCGISLQTSYAASTRPVLCESCYQVTV